jgi:hypothetical protein
MTREEMIKQFLAELKQAMGLIESANCVFDRRSSAHNFYDVCRHVVPKLIEAMENDDRPKG